MSAEMGQWVWDTMISMTLLMAIVLILRKPVSHYFGPKIAYLLWILPFARLFMPVLTLEAPAPVETVAPIAAGAISSDMILSGQAGTLAATGPSIDWVMVALILWLGGAGLLFLSKLGAYFQFREDIITDGQTVGRHGNIKILETAAVSGPLAFGLFRKYIAVPTDFFRNYAPLERELALEHEIAHHESGDLAANFAGLVILSLHWFNPIAWFAWIAFREDQETACDARILQKTGHDTRAVYGRTIAKSASGHKLGLASPLNQKDKIKGRLKMLGQGEKSGFRRRLGALIVGLGTIASLPLTATVVYAEAEVAESDDAHDIAVADDEKEHVEKRVKITVDKDGKKKKTVKIRKRKGAASSLSDEELAEADHVRKIERDGKTIVIRTNKPISEQEFEKLIEEAEASHREAEQELREHEHEMKEHDRESRERRHEMRIEKREIEREINEARREAMEAMRESQREVHRSVREAEREARRAIRKARTASRKTSGNWVIANQVAEISFAPRPKAPPKPAMAPAAIRGHGSFPVSIRFRSQGKCQTASQTVAFDSRRGVMTERAWAALVNCSGQKGTENRKRLLEMTLRTLEASRDEMAKACRNPDARQREKLKVFDREIKHLQRKITTA